MKVIVLFLVVIFVYSTNAHFHHIVNDVNNELRSTLRGLFNSLRRSNKPKWYHEHHRPEPVVRPFDRPEDGGWVWPYVPEELPEVPRTPDRPVIQPELPRLPEFENKPEYEDVDNDEEDNVRVPVTSTTSTTTTTTLKPTQRRIPERPANRRPNIPVFPNRRTDSDSTRPGINEFSDKPGYCPVKSKGPWTCSSRCALDSDCRGDKKCCKNRCGALACISPEIDFNIYE